VQDVEDIPGDIERRWDGFEQDVEDVPGDIAGGVGDMVGGVERFGDGMGDGMMRGWIRRGMTMVVEVMVGETVHSISYPLSLQYSR